MPKTVGLTQQHKKYLEILKFPNDSMPCAALLYHQAISFFRVFKLAFGNGSKTVKAYNNENKTFSEYTIGNIENLSVCLVNYHLSVELMLKALICLKEGSLEKDLETHNLIVLLEKARPLYSALAKIDDNTDYKLILQELSNAFNQIRYAEATIALSHNKRSGWKMKMPLQELSDLLVHIFVILSEIFEEARK